MMKKLLLLALTICAFAAFAGASSASAAQVFSSDFSTPRPGLTLGLLGSVCACGAAALRNGTKTEISSVTLRKQIEAASNTASRLSAQALTVTVDSPLRGATFTRREFCAECDDTIADDERPNNRFPIPQYDREALTHPAMA